jgi:redox-sensitive bicupin YhaK (pirin superfamily)
MHREKGDAPIFRNEALAIRAKPTGGKSECPLLRFRFLQYADSNCLFVAVSMGEIRHERIKCFHTGQDSGNPRQSDGSVNNGNLVLFEDGEEVNVSTRDDVVRFLLISGRPIGEPVAWYGPVVMNTQEELRVAFEEYRNGTFIKHEHP